MKQNSHSLLTVESGVRVIIMINFQKANWKIYGVKVDEKLGHTFPTFQNYKTYNFLGRHMPRGFRTSFVPRMKNHYNPD